MPSNFEEILAHLEEQRARIQTALDALKGIAATTERPSAKKAPAKKRTMSPAARKKMALLMKRRWAAAKKAGKPTLAVRT